MHARPRSPLLAAALLTATLAGCDLSKTLSQVQARHVLVGTVLHTPEVQVDGLAASGLDAGAWLEDAGIQLPDGGFDPDGGWPEGWDGGWEELFDGGIPGLDGGISVGPDGKITFPAFTVAAVQFSTRSGSGLEASGASPVADAAVVVQPEGGVTASLTPDGRGGYTLTSVDEPEFSYVPETTYRVVAEVGGERFVARLEDSPAPERIPEFHPDGGTLSLAAGQPFTFTRPEPPQDEVRNFGLVTVFPVSSSGSRGNPTYTTAPTRPSDVLSLVASPAQWRTTQVTLPGTAFPEPNTTYVVLFQSMKLGGADSSNLFAGSVLLVGTADVAVVRTASP
jgi:hypothetical protein